MLALELRAPVPFAASDGCPTCVSKVNLIYPTVREGLCANILKIDSKTVTLALLLKYPLLINRYLGEPLVIDIA